ncbi:MAG: acetate--CoA ligase family protein [Candidatus Pacearchaeota archaeon]|nr:acetate--CoA ligase family protein [Candidatus Pacearchaeota archaeon]
MKVFTEQKSGEFLRKFGFNIVKSIYVKNYSDLERAVKKFNVPFVVKVFGKSVVHKKRLGGVALDVKNYEDAEDIFERFKTISGAQGVVVQEQVEHKEEFLVGIQKTPEFGHVIGFGVGGSDVEKLGKVSFRVCSFDDEDARDLVNDNYKDLSKDDKKVLVKVLLKFCKLVEKFPKIEELDINPLIISKRKAVVLDSRIVWEN